MDSAQNLSGLFVDLKPSEVFFSQNRINFKFRCYRLVGQTLDDIMEGRCDIKSIPMISVMKMDGKWVSADNRRLWLFRHLERLGKCSKITAMITSSIPESKLNSENGGRSVLFYNGMEPTGEWHKNVPSIEVDSDGDYVDKFATGHLCIPNESEGGDVNSEMTSLVSCLSQIKV